MVWKCMTPDEQEQAQKLSGIFLNINIDVMHLDSKGSHIEKKYDPDNAVLAGRCFHNLLDTYKSPVTGLSISREERDSWIERVREVIEK